MSYRNLIKTIDVEENSNEMFTALRIYGDGDLDIATVNPLGTNVIYNFDHYKNTTWMSQDLINAINTWETKIGNNIITYGNALVDLKNKNSQRISLAGDLTQLQSELQALQNIKDARQQQGLDYSDVDIEIGKKNTQISNKQTEINNKQSEIDIISNNLKVITDNCSFKNNFTPEQLKKLDTFIIENTYQNEWFIATESMTNEQIRDVAFELYEDGKNALKKISKPTYRFDVDSVNFLNLKEFKDFAEQLELAAEVTIDMDDGNFVYPILVGYDFDYENENSFNLLFSDKLRYDSNDYTFGELFSDVSKLGSSAISKAYSAKNDASSAYDRATSALNNSLLANSGVFQAKFDLLDMGKKTQLLQQMANEIDGKVIQINEDLAIIGHTIAEKETEWNKISNITNEMGEVLAGKIAGNLNSSVNNIINADGTVRFLGNGILAHNNPSEALSTKATLLNASGLLVANAKNPDNTWKWTTAIDGDGINASAIKTGILSAVKIDGVEITGTIITGGTIKGAKFEAMEILSGTIKALDMTAGKITGGIIEGITINTATLNTVTLNSGTINAVNITSTATITGATINGATAYFNGGGSTTYSFTPNSSFRYYGNGTTDYKDMLFELSTFGYLTQPQAGCFSSIMPDGTNRPPRTRYFTNGISNDDRSFILDSKGGIQLLANYGECYVRGDFYVYGEMSSSGAKPATVPTEHYGYRKLYAEESDRIYFNTHGVSNTINNKAIIKLDDVFFETIEPNSVCEYLVNLTPYGLNRVGVKAVYDKYIIIESDADCKFTYTIRCTRKGYADVYIPETNLRERRLASQN